MATTTFTELSQRRSGRTGGFVRTVLGRVIEARERQARRYLEDRLYLSGAHELDASVRESLFEGRSPERR